MKEEEAGLHILTRRKDEGQVIKKEISNDKKKGKKGNGDKEDFLELDNGNKTEPMKSAAKSKKEETESTKGSKPDFLD